MTPKVLFIGGHDKGAWQMRGVQMAQAMGARYASRASSIDWDWPDVIVLVKRAAEVWWKEAAASGKPIIWDVLDFWRQPRDNDRPKSAHLDRIAQIRKECRAALLIGATRAMAEDIGGVYLPHHSRLGLVPTPPRERLEVVAYDGSPRYLGAWKGHLERVCARMGLRFVINPPDLSQVDLLVAFRDTDWDGWACRHWKSGVKYVNAIAAGRPILTQRCVAEDESFAMSTVVEHADILEDALHFYAQASTREVAYIGGQAHAKGHQIDVVAEQYRRILIDVVRRAA